MTESLVTTHHDSPVGRLTLVASDRGARAVLWPEDRPDRVRFAEPPVEADHPVLAEMARQLDEYFAGERREFDLPLDAEGTEFQRLAWDALRRIPYGATSTYAEQARAIGRPTAVRAVGSANGRNPLSIIVPCHRVVAADGGMGGFAGGLDTKRALLDLEASTLADRPSRPPANADVR